jgi:hypothetical protein
VLNYIIIVNHFNVSVRVTIRPSYDTECLIISFCENNRDTITQNHGNNENTVKHFFTVFTLFVILNDLVI